MCSMYMYLLCFISKTVLTQFGMLSGFFSQLRKNLRKKTCVAIYVTVNAIIYYVAIKNIYAIIQTRSFSAL